jgi:hypothetical protein
MERLRHPEYVERKPNEMLHSMMRNLGVEPAVDGPTPDPVKLVATWRDRVSEGSVPDAAWYFSHVSDPCDWDYDAEEKPMSDENKVPPVSTEKCRDMGRDPTTLIVAFMRHECQRRVALGVDGLVEGSKRLDAKLGRVNPPTDEEYRARAEFVISKDKATIAAMDAGEWPEPTVPKSDLSDSSEPTPDDVVPAGPAADPSEGERLTDFFFGEKP